jgi:hypothetical protein
VTFGLFLALECQLRATAVDLSHHSHPSGVDPRLPEHAA